VTEEQQQMMEDCEARESKLTDWERGFIDSMTRRRPDLPLSQSQAETLDRIWDRVTA